MKMTYVDNTVFSNLADVKTSSISTNKNYFLGPNLKIDIKSPFYKNYFYAGLKIGAGFMMDFYTTINSSQQEFTDTFTGEIKASSSSGKSPNDYMFCPQVDLEASLGYMIHHFKLEVGLNQFLFVTNLLDFKYGTLTFGGPYIKAGYQF
jgi:hypothetical protein